jgi:flagellar biosynthesis/type III secretory pathway M-ring protein FliF/YscJ
MGFFGVLLLVGLIGLYWKWIVGAVVVWFVVREAGRLREQSAAAAETERVRLAALAARADQQHMWAMQGDPRGMYSEEAMPTIRKYQQVAG